MLQNAQIQISSPITTLAATIRAGFVLAIAATTCIGQSQTGDGQRPARLAFRPTQVAHGRCDALPGRVVVKF
ncbi:MAG TPA: hypothetical protein PKE00_07535, partial [Planctomycetota bacterium]|nr:hypothetical protein [Planctomycetota bacterium]